MKPTFTKLLSGMVAFVCLLLIPFSGTAQSGPVLSFVKTSNQCLIIPHSSSINLGANFTAPVTGSYVFTGR